MSAANQSIRRSLGVSWFVHAVGLVIGFFLMPYVIGVLGDNQYGVWVFINCLASYSGLLYLGFGTTISRFVAKYSGENDWNKLNQAVSLVFFIFLATGTLAVLIFCGIAAMVPYFEIWKGYSHNEIRLVVLMLGVNVFTGLLGSVFGGVLIGMRRFDLERSVSFCCDIVRVSLIVIFLRREWGLLTIATIYWGVTLFENGCYLALAYWQVPQLTIRWRLLSREVYRECISFSGFAFLNAIAHQLIYAADTIVIGIVLGDKAITPYFIAQRLCQYMRQPIEKISDICMPTAGAMQASVQSTRLPRLLTKAFGLTFMLSTGSLIGAWYFAPAVIKTWMGAGYHETPILITILLIGQLVSLPTGVVRSILFGMGVVRLPALIYLSEAIANLIISLILITSFQLQGVAWGTTIPIVLFELFFLLPYGLKQINMSMGQVFKCSILPQVIPLLALWGYSHTVATRYPIHDNWPALIAITICGGTVLVSTWYLTQIATRHIESKQAATS